MLIKFKKTRFKEMDNILAFRDICLFVIVFVISIILSYIYDESLWKPFSIIGVIFPFVYILCGNKTQNINFLTMGLVGYIAGLLYQHKTYEWSSLLIFIFLYFNFFNVGIMENNTGAASSMVVGRSMVLLVVLGLTIIISHTNTVY